MFCFSALSPVGLKVNWPQHSYNTSVHSVTTWTAIEDGQNTFLFWGQQDGSISLGHFRALPQPTIDILRNEKASGIPVKSDYFVYQGFLWLVVGYRNSQQPAYIGVYQVNATNITRRQRIQCDTSMDFDVITLSGNRIYLAVSSFTQAINSVKLYLWIYPQFDEVATKDFLGSLSVKLFTMSGTLYITVVHASPAEEANANSLKSVSLHVFNPDKALVRIQVFQGHLRKAKHFRVDGNDYLVFVGEDETKILWWAGDKFIDYQVLAGTRLAIDVTYISVNREIILAVLFVDKVMFFQEMVTSRYELIGMVPNTQAYFKNVKLFSFAKYQYFALFTYDNAKASRPIYSWRMNLIPYTPSMSFPFDPLDDCLQSLESTLSKREEELNQLLAKADRVWVTDKPQTVTAPVIVNGPVQVRGSVVNVKSMLIANTTRVPSMTLTNSQVKTRIDKLAQKARELSANKESVVLKSKNQTIRGTIIFTKPISATSASIRHIVNSNVKLNSIPFAKLADQSLMLSGNQVITGHWTFANNVFVDRLIARGKINELNVSDAMLINSPNVQIVTGNQRYSNVIVESDLQLPPYGLVNGINPATFVTTNGVKQVITGQKSFSLLRVKRNIIVDGLTNGKKLNSLTSRAVLLHSPSQVISGSISFESPIQFRHLQIKKPINDKINITELSLNAVNIYANQLITGRKTFSAPVTVLGSVNVVGTVNGVKISRDLLTTSTPQNVTGTFMFNGPIHFARNLDTETINGINLNKEAVRRASNEPQVIIGRKSFERSVTIEQDVTMDDGSTIDGVDPSELRQLIIDRNNTTFHAPVTFENLIVYGNITVPSINNRSITDLPNILWLKSRQQVVPDPVKFLGTLKIDNIEVEKINGFRFPEDFVSKTGINEPITGQKTFVDVVNINGSVNVQDGRLINGIDMTWFARNVVTNEENRIRRIVGRKTINSIHVKGNIFAEKVNNLDLRNDVLLKNKPQVIRGAVRFLAPVTLINGSMQVLGDINVAATVNNVSLPQFVREVVQVTNMTVKRPIQNKFFAAGLKVNNIHAFGTINNIDIDRMRMRVVTVDKPQVILAHKNFTGPLMFENDVNAKLLNNLNIFEYAKNVVQQNQQTTVRGMKRVRGKILCNNNIRVNGLINGIDVASLQQKAMSKTRDNVISAPMTFTNDVTMNGLVLKAAAKIDGIRPSDLVLLNENTVLEGKISINNDITVLGDIFVGGKLNNCDLKSLRSGVVMINQTNVRQLIRGQKVLRTLKIQGNLETTAPLNNINIQELNVKVLRRSGDQQVIAPLTFQDGIHVDNLILKHTVNGHNITYILNDAVLKSKPFQVITGELNNIRLTLF